MLDPSPVVAGLSKELKDGCHARWQSKTCCILLTQTLLNIKDKVERAQEHRRNKQVQLERFQQLIATFELHLELELHFKLTGSYLEISPYVKIISLAPHLRVYSPQF